MSATKNVNPQYQATGWISFRPFNRVRVLLLNTVGNVCNKSTFFRTGVIPRSHQCPTSFWALATSQPGRTPRSLPCLQTRCRDALIQSRSFLLDSPRPTNEQQKTRSQVQESILPSYFHSIWQNTNFPSHA